MWHTVILHGNSKQYEEEEVNIMPWKRLWDLVKIWTFKKVEQEEMLVIFFLILLHVWRRKEARGLWRNWEIASDIGEYRKDISGEL